LRYSSPALTLAFEFFRLKVLSADKEEYHILSFAPFRSVDFFLYSPSFDFPLPNILITSFDPPLLFFEQ